MAPVKRSIYIGFDRREAAAFAVARHSVKRHLTQPIPVHGLVLDDMKAARLYRRPMERRLVANSRIMYDDSTVMWDTISDAPMSTEHACARFLVPHLARSGWALFMDGDMLATGNLVRLFDDLDPQYAVYVVKHDYRPTNAAKMDNQVQSQYNRKLWSAFCVFNCNHASNEALTIDYVNSVPGRDMHAFAWLRDDEIGELDPAWHWVPGHNSPDIAPQCVHFTAGTPDMPGYEHCDYSEEWRAEFRHWAAG